MSKNPIFEQTYSNYLKELSYTNFILKAKVLGAKVTQDTILVPFYNRILTVSAQGIEDLSGEDVSFAVKVVLCKYVLLCPETDYCNEHLVTFREFKEAAPLTSYFVTNTNKILETTYSGRGEELKERCISRGGSLVDDKTYDLSVVFHALPKIPLILNFNDCDDEFPATVSILFQASAEKYLDMESLSLTATYLTGILIENKEFEK